MLLYAGGGNVNKRDASKIDKLIKKAGSVIGLALDPLDIIVERRIRSRTSSIMGNTSHPLHGVLAQQQSTFSQRLITLKCSTERFRRSFIPTAIRCFNE